MSLKSQYGRLMTVLRQIECGMETNHFPCSTCNRYLDVARSAAAEMVTSAAFDLTAETMLKISALETVAELEAQLADERAERIALGRQIEVLEGQLRNQAETIRDQIDPLDLGRRVRENLYHRIDAMECDPAPLRRERLIKKLEDRICRMLARCEDRACGSHDCAQALSERATG